MPMAHALNQDTPRRKQQIKAYHYMVLTQLITNFELNAVVITHFGNRRPSKAHVLQDLLRIQDVPDWTTIHGFTVPIMQDNQ